MRVTRTVRILFAVALGLVPTLVVSCERSPDLSSTSFYSKDGISFSYPGNWTVSKDATEAGDTEYRYLFVESPGDAILIIQRYKPAIDLTLEEFAAELKTTRDAEVEGMFQVGDFRPMHVKSEIDSQVQAIIAGETRDGIRQSFAISVLGEKVPHYSTFFRIDDLQQTIFVVAQAATEDWELVEPAFQLVQSSLRIE